MAMLNTKQIIGSLTYVQAVKTGLIVAITIAIIVAIFSLFYCTVINPGYAEFMVHDAQKAMLAKVESQQDISQASVAVRKEFSAGMQVTQALVGQFVTGAIMSLIIGLFIKTKKKSA
jgi:cellobiose-specific phosphotransferase system component IIC